LIAFLNLHALLCTFFAGHILVLQTILAAGLHPGTLVDDPIKGILLGYISPIRCFNDHEEHIWMVNHGKSMNTNHSILAKHSFRMAEATSVVEHAKNPQAHDFLYVL
jgi:hypothetical protein